MSDIAITKLAYERRYADDSGVEYAVRYDANRSQVEFEAITTTPFPVEELDWLIDCLYAVRRAVQGRSP